MELIDYLKTMLKENASDLYLTTGAPPMIKVHGDHLPVNDIKFERGDVKKIAYAMMDEDKQRLFEKNWEMNMALSIEDVGRFRVNIFLQRNEVGIVIRAIQMDIPHPEDLSLPDILKEIVMKKSGLILFVGATGTGKSTSLASLIQYRNERATGHIITIEDPIEFLHQHIKSVVNQREIGVDTMSYSDALENAMRQAPDVILEGEVRDRKAMEYAMTFAETGHLCLTTLHAHNSSQAIDRIINFFPQERHKQLLLDLSLNLTAVVSQRLIKTEGGKKRMAAFEILLNTPLVADMIKRGEVESLREVMQKSESLGMQTFDTAIYNLYNEGKIDQEEALRNADSPNNLRIKINLAKGVVADGEGLSIQEEKEEFQLLRGGSKIEASNLNSDNNR